MTGAEALLAGADIIERQGWRHTSTPPFGGVHCAVSAVHRAAQDAGDWRAGEVAVEYLRRHRGLPSVPSLGRWEANLGSASGAQTIIGALRRAARAYPESA